MIDAAGWTRQHDRALNNASQKSNLGTIIRHERLRAARPTPQMS
jgi:hypothetical protein